MRFRTPSWCAAIHFQGINWQQGHPGYRWRGCSLLWPCDRFLVHYQRVFTRGAMYRICTRGINVSSCKLPGTMQVFIGAIAVFVVHSAPLASGYSMYAMRVPNGDKVPGVTALGHLDPVLAGPMNEFGMDMIDSDSHWTKDFCMKDSDGDGQTNGQELGDPCCEFVFRKNPKVRWTDGISHPGDATFMSDPKLWEGIACEEPVDAPARPPNASVKSDEEAKTEATEVKMDQHATEKEETEETVKVSKQKTEGFNEVAEAAVIQIETGVSHSLFLSSLLSAVIVLSLLAFVVVRMRRRRIQWTLLPQQGIRTQ